MPGVWFSKKLCVGMKKPHTKQGRSEQRRKQRLRCRADRAVEWEAFGANAPPGAMAFYLPREIQSPQCTKDIRDPWVMSDGLPPLYLDGEIYSGSIHVALFKGPLLTDPVPQTFYKQKKHLIIIPASGLKFTCTKGEPTLSAELMQQLAVLNNKVLHKPGVDRVFREREVDTDAGEPLDIAVYVTPRLFL